MVYAGELSLGLRQVHSTSLAAWHGPGREAGKWATLNGTLFVLGIPKAHTHHCPPVPLSAASNSTVPGTHKELAPAAQKPLHRQSGLATFGSKTQHYMSQ